jgi:type I restriction enzyme, S subunit
MIAGLKPYSSTKDSGAPWLGTVPAHWERRRLKSLLRTIDRRSSTGTEILLSLRRDHGIVVYSEHFSRPAQGATTVGYKIVNKGQLVVNRLQANNGLVFDSSLDGLVSPDYSVFEPRDQVSMPFLSQLLRTATYRDHFRRESTGLGTGSAGFLRLYDDRFLETPVVLPPVGEQTAILRFLNHADRRIRRYIRSKQKLIKLLEEQKQAVIHRTITRGRDPNVTVKPSGVDWLGDVPEHWEVKTLGRLATSFRTGPFGSILHQSDYVDGGTPLVNPTHMKEGKIVEDTGCSVPPVVAERLSNYVLAKHDLIFSRRGELGRCALVRDREAGWLCGTGSIRIRVNYDGIEPEYLIEALQVRWVGEYLSLFSVGATMDSLNTGILKGVPVLLPPISEQRQLLQTVARMSQTIGQLMIDAQREISVLREYRNRLISDVVTGQLDVREAAARLPEDADEPEPLDETESQLDSEEVDERVEAVGAETEA